MNTQQTLIARPGPNERTVRLEDGSVLKVPPDWDLLPPGDAGLTRRVKASGPSWTVQEKRGRKTFSQGIWAPRETIHTAKQILDTERAQDTYIKRRASNAVRREKKQVEYVEDFQKAIRDFLRFAPAYETLSHQLADAVAAHATPVGSGTVARTKRIPIEQRAEAAVIAWMRHHTTAYDEMRIARIKGKRREVRRLLAEVSRCTLDGYRRGSASDPENCALQIALNAKN